MRNKTIKIFYNERQVLAQDNANFSKSPMKPKIVVKKLRSLDPNGSLFQEIDHFRPFTKEDFTVAHYGSYVHEFFSGTGRCSSNSLQWSPQFAQSVRYTNSSLYHAIRDSIVSRGRNVNLSPTSGFHHASPSNGSGFCTFSGQVIASIKLWREFNLVGAYLDLDGHYGNSIEDSRVYAPDINKAIPICNNINPKGVGETYIDNLRDGLDHLEDQLLSGKLHYIVWCHGADSHEDDDLGHQCTTKQWIKCAEIFYQWMSRMDRKLGRPTPLTLSLFGGYRKDHYESVINLHVSDIVLCSNMLLDNDIDFIGEVRTKQLRMY